jgi:signal transduction histidine kinase
VSRRRSTPSTTVSSAALAVGFAAAPDDSILRRRAGARYRACGRRLDVDVIRMSLDTSTKALNLRRRYIEGLLTRAVGALAFALFFAIAAWTGAGLTWHDVAPAIAILVALAAVNVPYWFLGRRTGFALGYFYLHWTVDLVAITGAVHFVGGIDAPVVQFAYLSIIPTAAIFVSRRAAFLLATGATAAYAMLAVAESVGWLTPHAAIWGHHYGAELRVFIVALSGVFFFVFAYLAGTLAELLRAANEELASAKSVIEEQNRILEERVHERTRALEARTAQLQERTDELEEMVHIVTHDLQNVAVASMETARKLVETEGATLSERGRRCADRLVRDSRVMTTMLRNLLEVANKTEVAERRALVDVASVVREAVARAHGSIESKGIEVVVGELPDVCAEEQKIHHVFENLLSNACKYVGDKPNPRIEIEGSAKNGSVEYTVRDNGVGIEATQLPRIFQLYHRAPDQMVGGVVQQGHGIGLAVVKRIVQRYGGRIWVESSPGVGSTFHLSFPHDERVAV